MGALDGVKRLWADPKKRPWVIGGTAAVGTAGVLAMRRPSDPDEAAAEDRAVDAEIGPEGPDYSGAPLGATAYGELPAVYVQGGGSGAYDGMTETDMSGVFAELDAVSAGLQSQLDNAAERNRAARVRQGARIKKAQKRATVARKRATAAKKVNKRQARQIARLKKRVQNKRPAAKRRRKQRRAA